MLFRTFPEESINGDSIEVVRQDRASEESHGNKACLRERQEHDEVGPWSEAQEFDETNRAIVRNAEVRRKASRHSYHAEAVAGDADQAGRDDCAAAGRNRREAGRSGRRASGRRRQGPRYDLSELARVV